VTHCDAAGSIRRWQETVGDIDVLVTTSKPKLAIERFKKLPEIAEVLGVSANTAASRYRYALEKLRISLAPHRINESEP